MIPEQTAIMNRCFKQLQELYGTTGAPLVSIKFAREFFVRNKYYDELVKANVEDIEGVSFLIMLTTAQTFLSMFDLIEGVHTLICYEVPTSKEFGNVAQPIHLNMEKFLHSSIMSVIDSAKKLDAPKEWIPELRPLINEMLYEKYHTTMQDLKKIGHDCSHCHIYKSKEECEIWREIPKPFNL